VSRMIRVVIVSMYEKLSKDGLEYGATRILNLWRGERGLIGIELRFGAEKNARRHTRYRVKRTSACGGCLGDHRR
jgi:hypothetical protein